VSAFQFVDGGLFFNLFHVASSATDTGLPAGTEALFCWRDGKAMLFTVIR